MPVPGAGKFKKLHKDKKPLNTQRVVISDTQKYGFADESNTRDKKSSNIESVDFTNLYEEDFLEDTPAEGAVFDKSAARGKHRGKKSTRGKRPTEIITEKPAVLASKSNEKRYKNSRSKKGSLSIFSAVTNVFRSAPKTSNSSALEFAGNKKRLGKKGRRNRRVFIYAGTGLAVAVLTLVIVLVPGEAAPAGYQTPGISPTSTQGQYVVNNTGVTPSASITPSEEISGIPTISASVSPTPTGTEIPTTPPDVVVPSIDLKEEVKKFMVEADLYYNDVGYSNNHYKYTEEEKHMLSQVIYREARGEGMDGMIAVGNVVMNRVISRAFPGDTIKSVLTTGQFAYYPDGKTNVWSNRAANWVLDYEVWVIPQNIYFFKVPSSADPTANWSSTIKYVMTIKHHAFYTDRKYGRGNKTPPRLFERTFKWPTMGCKPEMRVYKLQYMLNKLGYNVKADKYFGQDTKDAIIDFQKKHNLSSDGIAGERTLEELIKAFGEDKYYEKFCADE